MQFSDNKKSIGPWETDSIMDSFLCYEQQDNLNETRRKIKMKALPQKQLEPRKTCNYVDNVPGRNINIEKNEPKAAQPSIKKVPSLKSFTIRRASKSNPRGKVVEQVKTEPDFYKPPREGRQETGRGDITSRTERFLDQDAGWAQNTSRIFDFKAKENLQMNRKKVDATCFGNRSQGDSSMRIKLVRPSKSQEKRAATSPDKIVKGFMESNKSFLGYVKNLSERLVPPEEGPERNGKGLRSFDDQRRINQKVLDQQKSENRPLNTSQTENCSKLMNSINQILLKPRMPIVPLVIENNIVSPSFLQKKGPKTPMRLTYFQNDSKLRPPNKNILVSDLLNNSNFEANAISFTKLY